MIDDNNPSAWLKMFATALQWPVVVAAAFFMGRHVMKLEIRLRKAETNLQQLIERHMPQIHKALAEIRGLLSGRR